MTCSNNWSSRGGGDGRRAGQEVQFRHQARRAAAAVHTPLAGVDLLPGQDGRLYTIEVNAVPGWKGLAKAHNSDVARFVLEFVAAEVRRVRR